MAKRKQVDDGGMPRLDIQSKRMRLGDLRLLEVNARYMRHETFQALVKNIEKDGALSQAPFACKDEDGKYLVLSGNHRVKAGIKALGVDHEDLVMYTDTPLTQAQRVAIQLSHNSIVGEDDPATLKTLYESIEDIDWKMYAGLDDKTLELLEQVDLPSLSEPNLDFQPVTLLFLPTEVERVREAWKEARDLIGGAQPVWLARMSEYDEVLDSLDAAGKSHDVMNVATQMLLLVKVMRSHLTDLQDGFLDAEGEPKHQKYVSVAAVTGTWDMPAGAAAVVARAVQKMVDAGEVDKNTKWRALELWAADYLAGDSQ